MWTYYTEYVSTLLWDLCTGMEIMLNELPESLQDLALIWQLTKSTHGGLIVHLHVYAVCVCMRKNFNC